MSKLTNLTPSIRLSIKNPNSESGSVFGRGIADLCLGVREKGSLNAAAKSIGMAYSKAWRIIKETEAALEIQLLNRDGAHGSSLTDEGNKLLDSYLEIATRVQEAAEKEFHRLVDSASATLVRPAGAHPAKSTATRTPAAPSGTAI